MNLLIKFYNNRLSFISGFENLDFKQIDTTLVYDRSIDKKIQNPIMIIGEAPGANEIKQGIPFCGMQVEICLILLSCQNLIEKEIF